uniref:Uncharacterized protein n=1 Tax=Rhizophora mucronata TaxID=61149 RepID=A0A2P2NV01_RHIMU
MSKSTYSYGPRESDVFKLSCTDNSTVC